MFRLLNSALCISIAFSSAAESKDGETSARAMSREDEKSAALEIVRLESKTDKSQHLPFVLYTVPAVSGPYGDSTHLLTVVSGDASMDLNVRLTLTFTSAGTTWSSGDVTVVRGSCKNRQFLGNGLLVMGHLGSVLPDTDNERNNLDHVELIIAQLNRSDALQRLIMRNCPEPIVSANLAPFVNAREKYLQFRRQIEPVEDPGAENQEIRRSACIFTETFPGQQSTRFYIKRTTNLEGFSTAPHPYIEIYRLPALRDEARRCSFRSCAADQETPNQEDDLLPENGRSLRVTLTSDDWCRELDSNIPYTFQRIFERGLLIR